jgi:hypothetical protein
MLDRPMDALVLRDLEVRQLGRQVERVLDRLRHGDFRSADVKKLKNVDLYRAKLDDKNRLLFKLAEHEDRRVLLILEVVHNHDYAKARFLGGGSFRDGDFEPVTSASDASTTERLRYVNPASPALHLLDKPLSFDDAQATVFATPLPLIVIGPAGSGKTALTIEKLKTLPGHGLYLTRSSFLVENARSLYFANRYANDGQEIDFLSLGELLETIEVPRGREARWADFAAWYERMRGTYKLREPHRVWEEIKGVITGAAEGGPFLEEKEYLALGVRQSIFLGDERAVVYQLFRRWLEHLADRGLFDANIAAWERRARAAEIYDFLVVDEVQDITIVELRLALATLRDKRNFLLCGDSNQIVHPNLFSWARVKSVFYGREADGDSPLDRIHLLSANYRNTRTVTDLANRLLLIKQRRFGSIDRESNYLVESVSGDAGRVDLLADTPKVRAELDANTRRSARTAVIVLRDEDKRAARAAFSTPLVFSVHEAKGLEYDNVILFNLVSGAAREFRECTAGVEAADLEGALLYARARDKTDKSLDAYKFYVNALYVALTRAVRSLFIVEADPAHPLFELMAVDRLGERIELARDESSHEEWQREARRLELQGKTEQAETIRREILESQPVTWAIADGSTLAEIRAKAVGTPPCDKAAQQRLFEYALTYETPTLIDELVAVGFRHARKPEAGRDYIERTHYAEYHRPGLSLALRVQLRRHGVDFRNPLNETPLMVAARLGRDEIVHELLAQGADADLLDTAGRTPLRVAMTSWLEQRVEARRFEQVYRRLATAPIKVKVGGRMTKVDPSTMEWFLLNLCLVQYRRMVANAPSHRGLPAFKAPMLATILSTFPEGVLPSYRKTREYVSSMLAKNEVSASHPYSRRLFSRAAHGYYILNPALEIEVKGSWVGVAEVMGLPLLFETLGPAIDHIRSWLQRTTVEVARRCEADAIPIDAAARGESVAEEPRPDAPAG